MQTALVDRVRYDDERPYHSRLDIKDHNLVKGIHFEGLRVLGKPEDFTRCYYEDRADELIYMDTLASFKHEFWAMEFETTL